MMRGPFAVLILRKGDEPDVQVATFDAILQLLEKLDPWLVSLGIRPKNDRWHEALKIVARARERRQLIERGGQRQVIGNYISGLFDATEIHEIVRAFGDETSPALKEKVQRALSGPVAPLSEQPKNSVARNAMFELSLAADWKNGGAAVTLGEPDKRCADLLDSQMRELSCHYLQVDEIWTFVQKKARRVRSGDSSEVGDRWVFVAIDAETKLIPSYHVGKRTRYDTAIFLWDLYRRLNGRTQLTTDGLVHYTRAVPECFGLDVDFAQLVKLFGDFGQHDSEGQILPRPNHGGHIQGANWRP
jgi:IS1 family transposase